MDINEIIKEDLINICSESLDWQILMNKTVMVTGASGFIPRYIVYTLLAINDLMKLNIRVIGLVRKSNKYNSAHFPLHKNLKIIKHDVNDALEVNDDIDIIIHAASKASPKYFGLDPVGVLKPNVLGTINLLNYAAYHRIDKFMYISSSEVYGIPNVAQIPTKETDFGYVDPTNIRSCYAESKRMGENCCVCWSKQYDIDTVIVRPFHTYGPGIDLQDGRVFADFIDSIVNNKDICIRSDGLATRAFLYISDFIIGLFYVLFRGKSSEAYNIASDVETSIIALANLLLKMFPDKRLKVVFDRDSIDEFYIPSEVPRVCPDISKAKLLGWKPKVLIEDGFHRTIRSYINE